MERGRPSSSSSSAMVVFLALLSFLILRWPAVAEARSLLSQAEERELKSLNKPYVKTFEEYGITYDCVDIYKQPALDHPLLKNHTLQLTSSFIPKGMSKKWSSMRKKLPEKCPKGTVLIRRTTKEDLIRHKQHEKSRMQSRYQLLRQGDGTQYQNHYSGLIVESIRGPYYYGAMASFDVKKLSGISNAQSSSTEIIISKGVKGPIRSLNAVHAGYQVDYLIQGDNYTHFFTYWTSDGYKNTGCYNVLCKGFVQISTRLTPGMIYTLDYLSLSIFKDDVSRNWMLYNDREPVGYWPKELFSNMEDASQMQFTGVVNSPMNEPTPPMGSNELAGGRMSDIGLLLDSKGAFGSIPSGQGFELNDLSTPYYDARYDSSTPRLFSYGGPGGWKRT